MDEKDSANEKKEVEDYLKQYCMEECLDEIMNEIVIERPTNPYVAMALLCESKTLPEIIDVSFKSVIVCGELSVQANFTTNIATFTGTATYKQVANSTEPKTMRDYSMLREKIRDSILEVDPVNLFKVDECVAKLAGVDPAESLALSIACCRAGARHKGMKLYQYLAHTVGLKEEELCIPTPVVSVLSRIVEGRSTQDITVTSTKAATFTSAMEIILQTATLVAKDDTLLKPQTLSIWGSPCINAPNINAAAKLVQAVLLANDLHHDLKQGVHACAEMLLKQPIDPAEPNYLYLLDGPALPPRSGNDAVEIYTALWQEVEFISLSSGVYDDDLATMRQLRKRLHETAYDLKAANTSSMQYSIHGVGGDASCHLQIPLEATRFAEVQNVDQLTQDLPYNSVSLQLVRFPSVSSAVDVIRKARAAKWPVAVVGNNTVDLGRDSTDTFLADFAVGVGAGQFAMGGVYSAECAAKYNRMIEITEESPSIRYVGARFRK